MAVEESSTEKKYNINACAGVVHLFIYLFICLMACMVFALPRFLYTQNLSMLYRNICFYYHHHICLDVCM